MKLETEMKMLQAKIQAEIVKEETVGNTSRFSDASAKGPKLPHFQDGKDDLDICLTRFERFAESNNWSRDKWSSTVDRACFGLLRAAINGTDTGLRQSVTSADEEV
ncbi:hypothetical protein ElyMa_005003700 [Elysia marginata]|uniref:Uncharacterized protein n=1 Tax=Elysia marginata TaxID=1093978 RepID=A0AAV4J8N9_9GAST|nr:hypothetical protein ElyMa_005003700 [Elysia marginata]